VRDEANKQWKEDSDPTGNKAVYLQYLLAYGKREEEKRDYRKWKEDVKIAQTEVSHATLSHATMSHDTLSHADRGERAYTAGSP
jgi:hypothetical protein